MRTIRIQITRQSGPSSYLVVSGGARWHIDTDGGAEWCGDRYVGCPEGLDPDAWEAARQLIPLLTTSAEYAALTAAAAVGIWDVGAVADVDDSVTLGEACPVWGHGRVTLTRVGLVVDSRGWVLPIGEIPARPDVAVGDDVRAWFGRGRHGVMPLHRAVAEGATDVELAGSDWLRWDVAAGETAAALAQRMADSMWAAAIDARARAMVEGAEQEHRVAEYIRATSLASDVAMNAAADRGAASAFFDRL